ncbi:SRPBCC family protein [Pseudoneobacillus sp. C159]
MNNLTKLKILKPASEVFEAFVDPEKIGHFWFSSSSERWEQGKTVTLRYDEYNAEGDIKILEMELGMKIVFRWGEEEGDGGHIVTITLEELDHSTTIVSVNEEGFNENDPEIISQLIDNKEGWVYMLSCLKAYLEFGVSTLRASLIK